MGTVVTIALYGLIGGSLVLFGISIGKSMRTKEIDDKIANLHRLADEVKEKNNTMVDNLSKVYQLSNPDTSEFTEYDAMLMDMWID